jgi:phosphoglycerate kinase
MDAFGTAHRAQASTHGVIRFAPVACGGPLLMAELDALAKALQAPTASAAGDRRRLQGLDQLELLGNLVGKVDQLIVGGGIANTFIAAQGLRSASRCASTNWSDTAKQIMADAERARRADSAAAGRGGRRPLRRRRGAAHHRGRLGRRRRHDPRHRAGDRGPLRGTDPLAPAPCCGTGPVGVFEFDAFGGGTRAVAEAIAASRAFSIAGGGDTLAAVDKYGVADRISYISTGGGAFLEFCEGKVLPASRHWRHAHEQARHP